MNLMESFLQHRPNFSKKCKIEYFPDSEKPYLEIEDPKILAGFCGYLKREYIKTMNGVKVFLRGQDDNYDIIPSLFRSNNTAVKLDNNIIEKRHFAYKELINKIPEIYRASRFSVKDFGPILQHYGIQTPWIDLVDNIFTAIWFATYKKANLFSNNKIKYIPTDKDYGWIIFITTKKDNLDKLKWRDLREQYTSLSLRPHVQHGISVTKKTDVWSLDNCSLNKFIVASVKFPITKEWILNSSIFSTSYFFPNTNFDNTYKYLKKPIFGQLLNDIITNFNLEINELGQINDYVD